MSEKMGADILPGFHGRSPAHPRPPHLNRGQAFAAPANAKAGAIGASQGYVALCI
jgi:hypothetical protein